MSDKNIKKLIYEDQVSVYQMFVNNLQTMNKYVVKVVVLYCKLIPMQSNVLFNMTYFIL